MPSMHQKMSANEQAIKCENAKGTNRVLEDKNRDQTYDQTCADQPDCQWNLFDPGSNIGD